MENQRGGNHESQRSTVHNTRSIFHKRQRGLEELEVQSGTGGIKEEEGKRRRRKRRKRGRGRGGGGGGGGGRVATYIADPRVV